MIPGHYTPGMGGAMDLVTGAKKVIIAMQHTAKGEAKIVPECTLPLTSQRRVDLIVTELAVLKPEDDGLHLIERAPNVPLEVILEMTEARLIHGADVPEMQVGC